MARDARGKPLRPAELVRAAAIARRYYVEGASKIDIADEFGISRFKVARVLDEARSAGLVRIDITVPPEIDAELSDRLRVAFGLREAIVATTVDDSEEWLRRHLGEVAADYLTEVVTEGDVLGMASSRTLNAMTKALTRLPRISVVQLTGVLPGRMEESSVELVRRVAAISRGPAYPVYAPLILSDPAAARDLRRQPQARDAMKRYPELTKAVVAVGSLDPPDSLLFGLLSPPDAQRLSGRGIRTEVCARFMDDQGRAVPDLVDRVIAITDEQLRQVPDVIAVAGGMKKVEAIRATLKGEFVTALVTDAQVAAALLRGPAPEPDHSP